MQQDMLAELSDSELQELKARAEALLKARDEDRKAKALAEARALRAKAEADARKLLESVGLSVKNVAGKRRHKARIPSGKTVKMEPAERKTARG